MSSPLSTPDARPEAPAGAPPAARPRPAEPGPSAGPAWSARWGQLAPAAGTSVKEPVLVALSGGADSVLLLHWLAHSEARPRVFALHVDHGLRGAESRADAEFCRGLCRELGVPLRVERADLDARASGLEARARQARYRALTREAQRLRLRVILTGHHADDRLETLMQRWVRGDALSGLTGPRARTVLPAGSELNGARTDLVLSRPLLHLRRAEIRSLLSERGLTWREDSSNRDLSFTRNRIRHRILPAVVEACGASALEHLHSFGQVVEDLEDTIAERTARLAWSPLADALALGDARRLPRAELARLPRALARRALWRLLSEATGRGPGRRLLELLLDDLSESRATRRHLPGGWSLHLRRSELVLVSPPAAVPGKPAGQLPFPPSPGTGGDFGSPLRVPGELRLEDGRRITAEVSEAGGSAPVPRGADRVELDAAQLPPELGVRFPRPGDRFRPLGAPGGRRLCRFLADAGVPREQRARVPLVFAGTELVWVAGVRPCHARRVRSGTRRRLLLTLGG